MAEEKNKNASQWKGALTHPYKHIFFFKWGGPKHLPLTPKKKKSKKKEKKKPSERNSEGDIQHLLKS